MNPEWNRTASEYRAHRPNLPAELFDRLEERGVIRAGLHVLDLGTGTGLLARALALRGCEVVGIDPAVRLLEEAREFDRDTGLHISYEVGRAENTGKPKETFDLVTAAQAWHWFNRRESGREAKRVLRPGGRLLITHFDWLPLQGNVVEATEALILRYNPAWNLGGGNGIYPAWFEDLAESGFDWIESFSFDVPVFFSHEGWRGRIRASAGVGAYLAPDVLSQFDGEMRGMLASRFSKEPMAIPHRVFAVWGSKAKVPGAGRDNQHSQEPGSSRFGLST